MSGGPIPASPLPLAARAPGKCILFGEHAVVHGRPELLLAIDLYTQLLAAPGETMRLNGEAGALRDNPYLSRAMEEIGAAGRPAIDWRTVSSIPRSAGLGSSAALCAALATVLLARQGGGERALLAERAFRLERGAQGVGSPGDTSASVAGGLVSVNSSEGTLLWEVEADGQRWTVRRVTDPGWVWVVCHSGVTRKTADAVRAVGLRLARPDGPALLDRFAATATAGIAAVRSEDREATGRCLRENQELLREVGVSHERLEALIAVAAPLSFGAKLTGAGAGGSIVALPRPGREVELLQKLRAAGGRPFAVRAAPTGATLVPAPP